MKKFLSFFIAVALSFFLVACNNGNSTFLPESQINISSKTENVSSDFTSSMSEQLSGESEPSSVINDTIPTIQQGEKQTISDICEFYLDYSNIAAKVTPPQPSKFQRTYTADVGKVYVDVCIAYKNLTTREVDADTLIRGTLLYAGKYEYEGFSIIEEDDRSDFDSTDWSQIVPLGTEYIHMLFSVPEEVSTSNASIEANLSIGKQSYKIIVRKGTEEQNTESKNSVTQKTTGEIVKGEIVATNNTEFYIDYSNITEKVIPPNPDGFYTYYPADTGNVYVDVCFAYKNMSENDIGADNTISAELVYADKYKYSGFSIIEESSRSNFTYTNITTIAPLTTEFIHYLFELPATAKSSDDTIKIAFSIDGNTYVYKVR